MKTYTDKQMETTVARMLMVGVVLSALFVSIGGILFVASSGKTIPNYSHFAGQGVSLRSVPSIFRGAMRLNPRSVIELGILLLIATPVVRVALCLAGFARQKDILYIAVSATVFLILIYSLVRGGF